MISLSRLVYGRSTGAGAGEAAGAADQPAADDPLPLWKRHRRAS